MSPCPSLPSPSRWPAPAGLSKLFLVLVAMAWGGLLADHALASSWSHSTRDVYLDGRPADAVQVFSASSPSRLLVLAEGLEQALVVDLEQLTVSDLEKEAVEVSPLGTVASTEPGTGEPRGAVSVVADSGVFVSWPPHSLLIAPHQGLEGKVTAEDLWQAVPVWRALKDAYEPDPQIVEQLRAIDQPTDLTIAFGTWCGDSRRHVPALLSALEEADNPHLDLHLVGLRRGFSSPADFIRDQSLTNVPTVVVARGGEEIGRIVETPAGDSVEGDLAAISAGAAPDHDGRWGRETVLASGRYALRDSHGGELGEEVWRLWRTAENGRLLHSLRRLGNGSETEVWLREDEHAVGSFVEITRRHGDDLSRTRHRITDGTLSSTTRGNRTGIVEQHAQLPEGACVLAPATADAGRPWRRQAIDSSARVPAFVLEATAPAGRLVDVDCRSHSTEQIATMAGRFTTHEVEQTDGGRAARWWLHADLQVPVRGEIDGWGSLELVELEIAEAQ